MKKSRFYNVIGWVALALSIFTNTQLSIAIIVAFCLVMIYSLNVGDDDITEDMVSAAMNMSEEEMEALHIQALPADLNEALEEMEKDSFIQEVLGNHVSQKYAKAKREEWAAYRQQITDWEIDEYLYKI